MRAALNSSGHPIDELDLHMILAEDAGDPNERVGGVIVESERDSLLLVGWATPLIWGHSRVVLRWAMPADEHCLRLANDASVVE
jgi:hypothetical protein